MPGDALIPDPTDMSMQAVTVDAPPEDIWPWLVQIGYRRGGLYSTPLWWLGMRIMEPAAFIMTRRMLLGVKERAETRRASAYDNGPRRSTTSPTTDVAAHGPAPATE